MQAATDMRCVQCGGGLSLGRTRFCSAECLAQFKREQERGAYGHRHHYRCVECGHELHLGRRRKEVPPHIVSPTQAS